MAGATLRFLTSKGSRVHYADNTEPIKVSRCGLMFMPTDRKTERKVTCKVCRHSILARVFVSEREAK